ncbi:DUF2498 family protein [Vibrio salinus]|uniref:DUF2498 family protein n=1 Tax=Vibrio salinus TaxID=2899784 RepID=UPI001E39C882|nr:DUF2498 family protein [Vibrio salinus]MCE0496269.1 DUF2498 family protein [Vibrio salinus]
MSDLKHIHKDELLNIANKTLSEHEQYIEGMKVTDVSESNNFLIFKGDYFLDPAGLPTAQTTTAFNLYKYLAHALSKEYTLN